MDIVIPTSTVETGPARVTEALSRRGEAQRYGARVTGERVGHWRGPKAGGNLARLLHRVDMHRRELLRLIGTGTLLPFLPRSVDRALAFGREAHRRARERSPEALSPEQAELVTTLADLILPPTDTPGASDVGVTGFIDHLLAHWYHDDERAAFLAGLAEIDRRAGGRFVGLAPAEQTRLLAAIDQAPGETGSAESEFGRLKSLTLYGYFTSERVVRDVTRDPVIPGRFDGCVTP